MNKTRGGDAIPVELFHILKDDAVKVLHSICQKIWKTQQWSQDWKSSVHSNPKEQQCQRMFKLLYNCTHFTSQKSNAQNSPSQASIVHEVRSSRCSSQIQKRQRNQRSNCYHPLDHKKAREFQKFCFMTSASMTTLKPLTVWIETNCGKFFKRGEDQTFSPAS